MTTQAPTARQRAATPDGRGRRGLYVLAVMAFTCALTPAVLGALTDRGGGAVAVLVLLALGLLGLLAGLVGSLLLDVLLLLAVRIGGLDVSFSRVSRTVDRALPVLAAGIAVAAACTALLGPERAFGSPVPAVAMAVAAVGHVVVLFRGLPRLGVVAVGTRATVLGIYVAVPAVLIGLSGSAA